MTAAESRLALQVLEALRWREGQTVRQLHERLAEGQSERRTFERLLEGMAGAGLVEVREDAFSRDGKVIPFWRAAAFIRMIHSSRIWRFRCLRSRVA